MKISSGMLDAFLKVGKWSETADDNIAGENFTYDFFQKIYSNWKADPQNEENIAAIGLIPLGIAIGGWGVEESDQIPPDPDHANWKGTTSTGKGKHLMSYAQGGIGIPHADSGFLEDIHDEIKANYSTMAPKFDRLYALKGIKFDRLYANGGHCTNPATRIMVDLNGVPFNHSKRGYAGDSYCDKYNTKKSNVEDWQIFRHWMRTVLRTKSMQKFIIDRWIRKFWQESYERTMKDENGTIARAICNTRIRNSSPANANSWADESVEDQLKKYKRDSRWGVMLRAVNIWEALDGDSLSVRPGEAPSTWKAPADSSAPTTPTRTEIEDANATNTGRVTASALVDVEPLTTIATTPTAPPNAGSSTTAAAPKSGVVTASKLNVRKSASPSADKIGSLVKGTKVSILATNDDGEWFDVKAATGQEGWVASDYISIIESVAVPEAVDEEIHDPILPPAEPITHIDVGFVTASSLNIRKGPFTSAKLAGDPLKKGTKLTIETSNDNGDWFQVITPDNVEGWVFAKYVQVED